MLVVMGVAEMLSYILTQGLFNLFHPFGIRNALGRMLMRPVNTIHVDCTNAPCEYSYYLGHRTQPPLIGCHFT